MYTYVHCTIISVLSCRWVYKSWSHTWNSTWKRNQLLTHKCMLSYYSSVIQVALWWWWCFAHVGVERQTSTHMCIHTHLFENNLVHAYGWVDLVNNSLGISAIVLNPSVWEYQSATQDCNYHTVRLSGSTTGWYFSYQPVIYEISPCGGVMTCF